MTEGCSHKWVGHITKNEHTDVVKILVVFRVCLYANEMCHNISAGKQRWIDENEKKRRVIQKTTVGAFGAFVRPCAKDVALYACSLRTCAAHNAGCAGHHALGSDSGARGKAWGGEHVCLWKAVEGWR